MSPFRHVLAAHGVRHPAAYSILIVIAGMLVCMVTAVGISVQASNKAIDRALQVQHEQEARAAQLEAQRQAENKAASCAFIKTISDAYKKDPPNPPTETYKTIAGAWARLAERCE
jgi:hypothetical protein